MAGPTVDEPQVVSQTLAASCVVEPEQQPKKRPTVVHGYTLHETLGTGTFGRVRRATKDGREHAVKIVSREQLAATGMAPQLKREVAIQKSLSHPNIVELRQVLRSPNKLYLVLELASKGELYWLVQRNGPLPLNVARRALFQLADALLYGHESGVIHRDVKPENILFDANGAIKLTDYGLSTSGSPDHAHAYGGVECLPDPRVLRTACGSPHYCAPEVRSPGPRGAYDGFKADSWSVGVVLFLMLNGYLPFHDDDPVVLQTLVESHPIVYPDSMPSQPRQICENLLQRDPALRWNLDMVINHPFCQADPSLHRAVVPVPTFNAVANALPSETQGDMQTDYVESETLPGFGCESKDLEPQLIPCPSPPSSNPHIQAESVSPPAEGWYTFGSRPRRLSMRRASRVVPREEVPDYPGDDASFSEADMLTEEVPCEEERPRRKSVLSVLSLGWPGKSLPEREDVTRDDMREDPTLGKADPRRLSSRQSRLYPDPLPVRRRMSGLLLGRKGQKLNPSATFSQPSNRTFASAQPREHRPTVVESYDGTVPRDTSKRFGRFSLSKKLQAMAGLAVRE
jgi:serine/threonine protein kinase